MRQAKAKVGTFFAASNIAPAWDRYGSARNLDFRTITPSKHSSVNLKKQRAS